ncbi:hypothetical protein [Pseudomonas sp. GD03944]|uniref:iron chaperone n=1 Tax=Pseudomonas sp. GD03944 TaxID=2975409 RepID=UPI002446BA6D|nr:hypothetical protein [Pseudomonas sp. GD03944]MDH1265137.1 hypothetical protein [Pseudomonas sp. GD03944]
MSSSRFASVDDYLESLEPVKAHTLRQVIEHILGQASGLQVRLAWNVPQICRGSDYVFGVSAAKHHLALAPWSADVIDAFRPRLEAGGFLVKKNLFQVPADWEVDTALLNELVAARLAELAPA